jgi:hypothetical protein
MSTAVKWTAFGIALAAGLFAVWSWLFRDTTTALERDDIVATTTAGSAAPGDPGVYSFATSGFEEIDALGGARHEYPPETFVTISAIECGFLVRWDGLEERWTEWELCSTDAGFELASLTSFHRWFGQSNLEPYACEAGALLIPENADADVITFVCSLEPTVETYTREVVGIEEIEVAGTTAAAMHVRLHSVIEGNTEGIATLDLWWLEGAPLPVRFVIERDNVTDAAVGEVAYTERFEITAASLFPEG